MCPRREWRTPDTAAHRETLAAQLGRDAVRWDDDSLARHSRDTWCLSVLRALRGILTTSPLIPDPTSEQ